jgi:hypothetical protein
MEIPGERLHSKVIYHEGFVFHRNRYCPKQRKIYYTCKVKECKATGQKIDGGNFIQKKSHSIEHPIEPLLVETANFKAVLKEKALQETTSHKNNFMEESQKEW